MPYIFIVLALVVVGVGFTFFKSPESLSDAPSGVATESLLTLRETTITGTTTIPEEPLAETDPKEATTSLEPPAPVAVPAPTPMPTPTVKQIPAVTNNTYTDGTYSTSLNFRTPEDTYQMKVSVTVSSDKISETTVSFDTKGTRDSYSKRFSSAYQSNVIGQDLGTINVSRVGGASLTTRAFNNALDDIATQAKA